MRRLLLLVLVALGCVLVTQSPAAACDQPAGPLGQDLESARVVFAGTITDVSGTAGQPGGMVTYSVAVDRVWKGRIAETVKVTAPATVQACGLRAAKQGESWLVVGRAVGAASVATTSYEGTRLLSEPATRVVITQLGEGRAPGVQAPTETPEPELSTLTDDAPAGFWPLALPGAVLVLGGLVVLAATRALGRPKEA